jgi:predicted nuclease of predicted toxin-antitoxin system
VAADESLPQRRFLLDENVDARIGSFLKSLGHDFTSIAQDYPRSLSDREVLWIAHGERRILVTFDRDFGEEVFARGLPQAGVMYLRIRKDVPIESVNARLAEVLREYARELDQFLVVTELLVRIGQ